MVLKISSIHMQNNEIRPLFYGIHKINGGVVESLGFMSLPPPGATKSGKKPP